jgi:hypothetical protein
VTENLIAAIVQSHGNGTYYAIPHRHPAVVATRPETQRRIDQDQVEQILKRPDIGFENADGGTIGQQHLKGLGPYHRVGRYPRRYGWET